MIDLHPLLSAFHKMTLEAVNFFIDDRNADESLGTK